MIAQPRAKFLSGARRHACESFALWPYWHKVRVPKVIEAGLNGWDSDHPRLDRFKPSVFPQALHSTPPGGRGLSGRTEVIPIDSNAR